MGFVPFWAFEKRHPIHWRILRISWKVFSSAWVRFQYLPAFFAERYAAQLISSCARFVFEQRLIFFVFFCEKTAHYRFRAILNF